MNNLLKASGLCFNQRTLPSLSSQLLLLRADSALPSFGASSARSLYTFRFQNNRLHKYKRATRPKLSGDNSIKLTYEQAQFAEDLGVTKSWNIWNTCK